MGILPHHGRSALDTHLFQQRQGAATCSFPGKAQVAAQSLGHLVADGEHRVQGVHDVLENHADVAAADEIQLLFTQGKKVLPPEANLAPGDLPLPGKQPQDGQCRDALAAAAFAHDAKNFTLIHVKGNPVGTGNKLLSAAESNIQRVHLK